MQRAPTRFAYYNSFLPRGTRGTVMPTRMAVLSGSVEMVLDQAVSENFSAAVYARILNLRFNFQLICINMYLISNLLWIISHHGHNINQRSATHPFQHIFAIHCVRALVCAYAHAKM